MTERTNQAWVQALAMGNEHALQDLWAHLVKWSVMTARGRGGDEDTAYSAAVEAYQRILAHGLKQYDNRGSFLGYCRMITVNEVRRELQRLKPRDISLDSIAERWPADGDWRRHVPEVPSDLEECISQLDEAKRAVVVAVFFADEKAKLVAQRLGTTTSNVYVLKHRALDLLQDCLHNKGHDSVESVLDF